MGTARTVGGEWREGLWGSVGTGGKEGGSSTGRVWTAGFHRFKGPFSLGGGFETYETFICSIFNFLKKVLNGLFNGSEGYFEVTTCISPRSASSKFLSNFYVPVKLY
jgi:hypothetical protein